MVDEDRFAALEAQVEKLQKVTRLLGIGVILVALASAVLGIMVR